MPRVVSVSARLRAAAIDLLLERLMLGERAPMLGEDPLPATLGEEPRPVSVPLIVFGEIRDQIDLTRPEVARPPAVSVTDPATYPAAKRSTNPRLVA